MDAFGAHRLSDDQLLCDEYLAGDTPGAGNKYSRHKYSYAAHPATTLRNDALQSVAQALWGDPTLW